MSSAQAGPSQSATERQLQVEHITNPSLDSSPDYVPPHHESRTMVLCFDGTSNKLSRKNTNVALFFALLKKDDRRMQMVHYQPGIGTYTSSNVVDPITSKITKTVDSITASSIESHVKDGYRFLMENYNAGDRISIFGFSRGAYTARVLAGMIHKVGLLPATNTRQIKYAYKIFTKNTQDGWEQAVEFKRCFSINVEIDFVGIWDSVGSIGINGPGVPFDSGSTTIRVFRHAMALDERRALFKANTWNCPEVARSNAPQSSLVPETTETTEAGRSSRLAPTLVSPRDEGRRKFLTLQQVYYGPRDRLTDMEEVWFAGCHSDVGGGAVSNDTSHALSRIALRWMVRECFKAGTGILFLSQALHELGMDPIHLYPSIAPRPPPLVAHPPGLPNRKDRLEEEEEWLDALQPVHDRLKSDWYWWIPEVLPLRHNYEMTGGKWGNFTAFNLGRPRLIEDRYPKVHRSVRTRMGELRYAPKAKLPREDGIIWVD